MPMLTPCADHVHRDIVDAAKAASIKHPRGDKRGAYTEARWQERERLDRMVLPALMKKRALKKMPGPTRFSS